MNWPNRLTLTRILLIPFLIISIVYHKSTDGYVYLVPVVLFCIAALTDALDGYIARRFNLRTDIGKFLDPFADKSLILITLICLYYAPSYTLKMPAWILIIIATRDFIIITWMITCYVTHTKFIIRPNLLGKATTFFQMVTVIILLLQLSDVVWIWYVTAVLTVGSASNYIWRETHTLKSYA